MTDTHDTIDGLLAEFRGYSAGMPACYHITMSWADFRKMLDRFEAAHRRESGDAAKLREALIKARSAICQFARHQCQSLSWENSNIQANCGDVLCSWLGLCDAKTAITAALAAPPRNCDLPEVTKDPWRAWLYDESNWDELGSPRLEIHDWLLAPRRRRREARNDV